MVSSSKNKYKKDIKEAFALMMEQLQAEDDDEKKWLMQHCSNPELKALIPDIQVLMLHVLDTIGQHEMVNGVTITQKMRILKGTLSKVAKKLIHMNLVQTKNMPNNKKEIYYFLTPLGKELYELHLQMHERMDAHFDRYLEKYEEEELQLLTRFFYDVALLSWLEEDKKSHN